MKYLLLLVLLFAIVISGCGGDGFGGNSTSALRNRYENLMDDVNDEDLSDTMSNYSFDFFHDCLDWQEVRDGWDDLFSTPNYHMELSDLEIDFSDIDGNFGIIEGSFIATENDNGFISEEKVQFSMEFIREDGVWRLFGNQDCGDSRPAKPTSRKETMKRLLGKKLNSQSAGID